MTDPAPEANAAGPAPVPRGVWVALAVLIGVGAALRLTGLHEQGILYRDEEIALLGAETLLADVRAAVGLEAPPVFESIDALGASGRAVRSGAPVLWRAGVASTMSVLRQPAESAGRFLAALCGIAMIPAAFALGRRWFGDWHGAVAMAAVCTCVPSFIWWSRLGLPPTLTLLLLFGGLAALLHAAERSPAWVTAALSGAAFAAATTLDVRAWFLVPGAAIYLFGGAAGRSPRLTLARSATWLASGGAVLLAHAAAVHHFGAAVAAEAGTPPPALDVAYLPFWFWRREGTLACVVLSVGFLAHCRQRLAPPVPAKWFLLLLPLAGATGYSAWIAGRDAAAQYPFVVGYLLVALFSAAGLRALLRLRVRAVAISIPVGIILVWLAGAAPLVQTRSGTRDAAAWIQRDARAWLTSQGTEDAVLLIGGRMRPAVSYETRTAWRHDRWDDPPAKAQYMLDRTSAYLLLVGEEGHLNGEWAHVQPVQQFARTIPHPALFVSESPGTTAAKRARLGAGAYAQFAAYDAAAVAAHTHDPAITWHQANPYRTALATAGRFPANPVPANVSAWQAAFRSALREALGMTKIATPDPLRAQVTERVRALGYTRERVVLETEIGYRVPAFVLVPESHGPAPFVLALHGHGPGKRLLAGLTDDSEETQALEEERRDFALQLVQRGYAVIAPDQRGFGELRLPADIARGRPFSCPRLQLHAQLVGRSLIGDRVHDAMRWIDYARGREDMDTSRIRVAGHSGGGTTALFTAALDERVDVAFVSGYYGRFATSLGAFELCECNYAPGIAALGDIPDIAALVAPRRLRLSLGRLDAINPLAVAQAAFPVTRAVFDTTGGTVDLALGDLGHIVYPEHLWGVLDEAAPPTPAPAPDRPRPAPAPVARTPANP